MPDEPRLQPFALRALGHGKAQAARGKTNVLGLQPRGAVQRVAPQVERARGELCVQARALRVIDVDHGRLQAGRVEQRGLGLPVGLHAAVVVQVVLREVGEQGHADARARQALLGHADGRGFNGAVAQPLVGKGTERALQTHRVGGGHAGRFQARRHANAQSANQGTPSKRWKLIFR